MLSTNQSINVDEEFNI